MRKKKVKKTSTALSTKTPVIQEEPEPTVQPELEVQWPDFVAWTYTAQEIEDLRKTYNDLKSKYKLVPK